MTSVRLIKGYAILLALLLTVPLEASAQEFSLPERDSSKPRTSPNGWVSQTAGTHNIQLSYGRPYVKGRSIYGDLVPYDQVWRGGANEATAIVIPADAKVQGEDLKAGVYSLFFLPTESEWTVILNGNAAIWGRGAYKADDDVLRVMTTPRKAPHTEMLTYTFENVTGSSADVVLYWANLAIPFTISFAE